jgi:hypothetical protein
MPATPRVQGVLRSIDGHASGAADPALDGDWCITISRSHSDGQLCLQLEGRRSPAVLMAIDGADIADIDGLMRRLSAAVSRGRAAYRK